MRGWIVALGLVGIACIGAYMGDTFRAESEAQCDTDTDCYFLCMARGDDDCEDLRPKALIWTLTFEEVK